VSVESDVLDAVRPSESEIESISEAASEFLRLARGYISERGLGAEARYVGSFAKGTYLSDPDLDLFVLFPESIPRDEMEREGLRMGDELLGGVRMFAEHPYTRGRFRGLDVDLVPCYAVPSADRLRTAVDRTPFHTEYVLSRMDPALRDDVRLLKKFMKGIGAYGAEPNTRGFSGYMCELLVMHYGGFRKVLEASAGWKEGVSISLEKKGPPMIGAMVLYDPVDQKRNVASAVHMDTLALFMVAARAYLSSPSKRFFFPEDREPMGAEELESIAERHGSRLITVVFRRPASIEDNLYSQLWKTRYALARKLNEFDYNVLRAVHAMRDETMEIAFELERDVLSKTHRHTGPPVWVKAADSFLAKWRGNEYGAPFVEDGCWNVIAERMYFTAREMLEDEAAIAGIGREIDPETMKVRDHSESLRDTDPLLLTELLDPRHSWEA
jgi:tRNA nucleotidyltransferase (CCA-adding enzyme)